MVILLSKIPADSQKEDIANFIRPALRGPLYIKMGHIKAINLLALKDKQINDVEYYGLVRIEPDEVALKVIKKLNRKVFKGKRIAVREYVCKRIWQNDRRDNRAVCLLNSKDRRRFDRRRESLEIIESDLGELSLKSSYPREF